MNSLRVPSGFRIGHWTDAVARTGCTVVIPPPGARGGVDVRGGGTGTRELEALSPVANAEGPARGAVGAGAGAAVGKLLGRGRASPGGIGYSARLLPSGKIVAAIAVANAFGDVLEEDGTVLGSPRDDRGELVRTADLIRQM